MVVSGSIRLGIIAASLCGTAAIIWGSVSLIQPIMQWGNAHPVAAKVMPLLPLFGLLALAIVLQRRRNRISRDQSMRGA